MRGQAGQPFRQLNLRRNIDGVPLSPKVDVTAKVPCLPVHLDVGAKEVFLQAHTDKHRESTGTREGGPNPITANHEGPAGAHNRIVCIDYLRGFQW